MKIAEDENAVFLSGNGPLVEVLREALTRDEVNNSEINGKKLTKKEAAIKANMLSFKIYIIFVMKDLSQIKHLLKK